MTTLIPTMSSIGWIETVAKKADYVLSCFITCNKSQSVVYAGNITSLQYLIKEYASKSVELQYKLRDVLTDLMSNTFKGDEVDVDVQVDVPDSTKPAELSIRFNCSITVDGITYVVGKLVQSISAKIVAIKTLNAG